MVIYQLIYSSTTLTVKHYLLYRISLVEGTLQGLLGFLTSARCSPTQHLEQEQALARQFAEILHFTLRFDELKVGVVLLLVPAVCSFARSYRVLFTCSCNI